MKKVLAFLLACIMVFTPMISYADGENYVESVTPISMGTNTYEVDTAYEYTVFTFEPEETGKYTISSADSLLGVIYTMWITSNPTAETVNSSSVEWNCTGVGQSIKLVVDAEAASASITVEHEEAAGTGPARVEYVNNTVPAAFSMDEEVAAQLVRVDTFDDVSDTAVLASDGNYRLNAADGPVLYANLSDSLMSLNGAYSYGQLKDVIYEDGVAVTIVDYNNAFNEYYTAISGSGNYYPLTDDLIEMFRNIGDEKGWYGEGGNVGGVLEDAWMFACYYVPGTSDTDTPVEPVTPEVPAEGTPVPAPSYEYCIYSGDTVTVGAGETVYFEIGTDNVSGTYDFTVEGSGGFIVAVCTEGTETAYAAGAPIEAVDGKVETSVTSFDSTYCYGAFSITNCTSAEASYTCTVVFPEGSQGNPAPITLDIDTPVTVTVPAGSQYYFAAALPETMVEYKLTVTGNTGFGYSGGFGMPNWDTDGAVDTTVSSFFGPLSFALVNNTADEQSYTLTLAEMPLGSTQANPDQLAIGETVTKDLTGEYWYTWTAEEAGTFKLSMESEAWTYNLIHNDMAYNCSTGWGEADKAVRELTVAAGDTVLLAVSVPSEGVYPPVAGTLIFTTSFTAGEGETPVDPVTPVIPEEGTPVATPSYENIIDSGDTVTVAPGATVYFEVGTMGISDTYGFTVEGSGDFVVAVCTEGTETAYAAGAPIEAVEGKVETTITSYDSTYSYAAFSITNLGAESADYTCTVAFPEGSQGNPISVSLALGSPAAVTVPAGSQYYFAATLPAIMTEYQFTVTGNTGFGLSTGWMPVMDTDGAVTATATAYYETYNFSLVNNTASEQTYTLTLAEMPLGSTQALADQLPIGETVNKEFPAYEYWYTWTAEEAGAFKLSMESEAWTYNLIHNDMVYNCSTGWGEADKAVRELTVAAGDTVLLAVSVPSEGVLPPVAGTLAFTATFTAGDAPIGPDKPIDPDNPIDPDTPAYRELTGDENYTALALGAAEYAVETEYQYTLYYFEPTEIGRYIFTSDNSLIALVSANGMWVTVEPSADTVNSNTFTWDCTGVGQRIWVAAKTAAAAANITVEKEELVIKEPEKITYENKVTPESFTFIGDAEALLYVDTFDTVVDTAVLGDDGYYHLNAADGPILYVDLNDTIMDLVSAMGYGQLKHAIYDENGEVATVIDYNTAFAVYADSADMNTKLYPLTEDLIEIYKNVGESQNWYGTEGWIGGDLEDCWMFACYYREGIVNPFSDVADGKWYTDAILYCYYNGYMEGVGTADDGKIVFDYRGNMNRQMFATILAKIDGADTSTYTEMSFADVEAGKWYSNAIEWAYKNDYASGIGTDEATGKPVYGRKNLVTREQLALFFYTYSEKNGVDVSGAADLSGYEDLDRVHDWALKGMQWAVETELISGTSKTTLAPRASATRAEVSLIVMNYVENVLKATEDNGDVSVQPGENPEELPEPVPVG